MTIEQAPANGRIDWLDYARAICALSVVFYHYLARGVTMGFMPPEDIGALRTVAEYGYLGVDFFFMVSGFVIMMSVTGRSAADFAAARIVRLYPAFLFCMTTTAVVLYLVGNPALPSSLAMWLGNLPIAANALGVPFVDGVYWTLVLELVFYAMVFAIILLGLRERMEAIVFAWLAGQVAVFLLGWDVPLLSRYFLLFTAGCLLYFASTRGWTIPRSVAVVISLALNVESAMVRGVDLAIANNLSTEPLVVGTVVALFFLVFVTFGFWSPNLPAARRVGSLTYPLYLIHQNLGYVLVPTLALSLGLPLAALVVAAGMSAFAIFVAVFVEERFRSVWKSLAKAATVPVRMTEDKLARLRHPLSRQSA